MERGRIIERRLIVVNKLLTTITCGLTVKFMKKKFDNYPFFGKHQ